MQKMKSGLLIFLLPPLALAGNWEVMLPGGNMRFQGIVIAESCRVEAGDRQMTVKMGQISSNRFHSAGEDTNPVPFDIHLQECSTAVSQRVGVAFHGIFCAGGWWWLLAASPMVKIRMSSRLARGRGSLPALALPCLIKPAARSRSTRQQGHGRSCTPGQPRCILSLNIVPPGVRSPEEPRMLRPGSP